MVKRRGVAKLGDIELPVLEGIEIITRGTREEKRLKIRNPIRVHTSQQNNSVFRATNITDPMNPHPILLGSGTWVKLPNS